MPDRTYKLVYVVDDAGATPRLDALRKGVVSVDYAARHGKKGIDDLTTALAGLNGQITAAGTNLPGLNAQLGTAGTNTQKVGEAAHGLLPAWQVFEYGVQLAGKFGEYTNEARERMRELAKEAAETRDTFRELANLQGHAGPDDEVLAQTINMGMEAGMMPDDARRFMEQFEGSVPAGRQKGNIRPAVEQALAQEGMKFGTRVKINPNTAGDLAGVLPQYGKIDSAEEGAAQMGSIAHGLNEGRGNLEPLVRSLIKTAGSIVEEHGGPVEDLPELAAILGVASTNATPDRAGTMVVNAVRGLRQFKGKQGDELKNLGINPQMKFRDALEKIAPKIHAADRSGEGGDTYLREHGFDNEDEIKGILQLSRNIDVVRRRIADARNAGNGKKVMADNAQFLNTEKAGINRRVRARRAGQDQITGMQGEYSEMAMESGMQTMKERRRLEGLGNKARFFLEDMGGVIPFLGGDTAQNNEAKKTFMTRLEAEGKKVNVDVRSIYGKHGYNMKPLGRDVELGSHYFNDKKVLNEAIERVMEAGGKPFGDSAKVKAAFKKAAAEDKQHHARMAANPRGVPPRARPAAGPPAAPPGGVAAGPDPQLKAALDKMVDQQKQTNDILRQKAGVQLAPAGRRIAPGRK